MIEVFPIEKATKNKIPKKDINAMIKEINKYIEKCSKKSQKDYYLRYRIDDYDDTNNDDIQALKNHYETSGYKITLKCDNYYMYMQIEW